MIKGLNHVGVSVVDMDRSIQFYRDGFGLEVVENETFKGELYESIFGLKGATGKVALLKGATLRVELFEFAHPSPKPSDPHRPVCDHGITHFCVEVTDIARAYERLRAAGASFHCAPLQFFGNLTATYGRDPDGNVFELLEVRDSASSS